MVVREAAASDFQAIQKFKSLPDFLMFPVLIRMLVAVTPESSEQYNLEMHCRQDRCSDSRNQFNLISKLRTPLTIKSWKGPRDRDKPNYYAWTFWIVIAACSTRYPPFSSTSTFFSSSHQIYTPVMSEELELNCWIIGNEPHRIFPVKIRSSESVGTLKEEIKTKNPDIDCPADTLIIWKVSNVPMFCIPCAHDDALFGERDE